MREMNDDAKLVRLKALCEAASLGPWSVREDKNEQPTIHGPNDRWVALLPHQCVLPILEQAWRDAGFIAAAREGVQILFARLADLEEIASSAGRADAQSCARVEELHTIIAERDAEIARLRNQVWCGVCAGTPHASGLPCICGGTGLAQDEGLGARKLVIEQDAEIARLHEQLMCARDAATKWLDEARAAHDATESEEG